MSMHTVVLEKSAATVEWANQELGLTLEEIGTLVGASGRSVQRWKEQSTTPSRESQQRLEKLDELRFWLDIVFAGDTLRMHQWLSRRILDLQGRTPLEAIRQGEVDTIIEFLATYYNGAFI